MKLLWFSKHQVATGALAMSMCGLIGAPLACADTWRGTAPFCDGSCNAGERQIGVSNCGDGACCWTGHKALCSNSSATCQASETQATCYGVVEVCDNGYYEAPTQNWHSCDKYACGACLGFGKFDAKAFRPSTCRQGFVWREAVSGDYVCVSPATRTEASTDNKLAASRRAPNGGPFGPDTCRPGFVWREVTPSDHVCVTAQVRSAVTADNNVRNERIVEQAQRPSSDTCKQGFVWREAVVDDHVCVTPATRAQAKSDNAAAAARRSANGGPDGPDTCNKGFVWREVILSDHVCVPPGVRSAVAADSAAAGERIAR
jgi:hypothetical protein